MKKRLRKKLHIKEYAMYGFDFSAKAEGMDNPDTFEKLTISIYELVEERDWLCGGTIEDMFICESKPNMGIADKKEEFLEAVKKLPGIISVEASGMLDAWH